MRRTLVIALGLSILLPTAAAAATEELCLRVETGEASLDDAEAVKAGLADGTIEVLEVVPCTEESVVKSPAVEGPVGEEDTDDAVPATSADWVIGDIESDPLTDEPTALLGLHLGVGNQRLRRPHHPIDPLQERRDRPVHLVGRLPWVRSRDGYHEGRGGGASGRDLGAYPLTAPRHSFAGGVSPACSAPRRAVARSSSPVSSEPGSGAPFSSMIPIQCSTTSCESPWISSHVNASRKIPRWVSDCCARGLAVRSRRRRCRPMI